MDSCLRLVRQRFTKRLGESESRTHASSVVEVSFKGFGLVSSDFKVVLSVRRLELVQTMCLHALHSGSVAHHPCRQTTLLDIFLVFVVSKLDVFDGLAVSLGQQCDNLGIPDGSRTSEVVSLVAVGLLVQDNDNGSVGNVVGGDVVDTHTVGSRHESLVFAKSLSLDQERSRHDVRSTEDCV